MTAPHEVLAKLRTESGMAQMVVFAEALHSHSDADAFRQMSLIAAAYMLGRVDGVSPVETPDEPNGSAGPMAEAVLRASRVLQDVVSHSDLPF